MDLRSPSATTDPIPSVDLSAAPDEVAEALVRASTDWGFFYLTGHGLPPARLEAALAEARRFFASDIAAKRTLSRTRDNPWGYYDRELTKNRRDKKEIFDLIPAGAGGAPDDGPFSGETPWPAWQPDLEPFMAGYFRDCEAIGFRLVGLLAQGLGVDPQTLTAAFRPANTSFLRLNYYPTVDPLEGESPDPAGLGIHHHTDAGAVTVLLPSDVPGLQVLKDDAWHTLQPVPGALIINIGDMVQVWSNDLCLAPLHRVQAMETDERLSLAFFFNPSYAATISPLPELVQDGSARYRPISWGEFRRRRADGDFADYGAEVQIADYRTA